MAKKMPGKRGLADLTSIGWALPKSDENDSVKTVDEAVPPPSPREFKIPIVLLGIGIIVLLVAAFFLGDVKKMLGTVAFALTILLVQIPATVLALYILSSVAGIAYGNFWSAILKLAAIIIFIEGPAFAGMMLGYPITSRVVLLPVVGFLFSYLFDLDFTDTFYSLLGMAFVSAGISWLMIFLLGNPAPVPT